MKNLIEQAFDIKVHKVKALNAYDNANYKISADQEDYIYKTYPYSPELYEVVQAENEVLLSFGENWERKIPHPIPFADQSVLKIIDIDGEQKIGRMLSFLDGAFLGEVTHTVELLESLGTFIAQLDRKLSSVSSSVLKGRQWEWDLQYFDLNKKYLEDIPDPKDQNIVRYFFLQFEEVVRPLFPELRKQLIHNDANEWNILVKDGKVTGIIDFGDLAHSFLINEMAIALTYACYDKDNPLEWAVPILSAYHAIFPIEETEIQILYYLIAARLCTSVCNSAHARKVDPDNAYATVSEQSAWKMLRRWLAMNPIKAEQEFRKAVGFPTVDSIPVDQVISRRHQSISPILSMSYHQPIYMERAAFQYMYDASGNTFLDAYNNISHVGHSHPRVVEAGQRQMAKLNTNTRYLYDQLAEYAEKLLSYFPNQLNRVFFVNSGSAASDLAMRMAQVYSRHPQIMVMESGYHGNTQISIDISDYKFNHPKGQGQKHHIMKAPLPSTYRGKYANTPNAGTLYGADAVNQIQKATAPIAAFISEPVLGCAGQVPLANGYLQEVYPAIRAQGGLCISDEVQTGFGRLGDHFWGYEAQEVVPDMVVLGKPIANGHPMGAVVCTSEVAAAFEKGVEFFSSFGGNPVSCVIASAVLDVIEEEALQQNAKQSGDHYLHLFKQLAQQYPCIGDVRGSGLFLGVELVKEDGSPDTALARHIKNEMRNRHILISTDGPFNNVIKTKPPLCFNVENVEQTVGEMKEVLERYLNK